ncbi:hypothetical protein DSECCO2_366220 [anaerobic digester metagenome]
MTVVIEPDEDGYAVFSSEHQGCSAQGETWVEAITMLRDAISLHIEDRFSPSHPGPSGEVSL